MKHTFATAAVAALVASLGAATPERIPEDMLHTARMSKRAINADGDFHMCMPLQTHHRRPGHARMYSGKLVG